MLLSTEIVLYLPKNGKKTYINQTLLKMVTLNDDFVLSPTHFKSYIDFFAEYNYKMSFNINMIQVSFTESLRILMNEIFEVELLKDERLNDRFDNELDLYFGIEIDIFVENSNKNTYKFYRCVDYGNHGIIIFMNNMLIIELDNITIISQYLSDSSYDIVIHIERYPVYLVAKVPFTLPFIKLVKSVPDWAFTARLKGLLYKLLIFAVFQDQKITIFLLKESKIYKISDNIKTEILKPEINNYLKDIDDNSIFALFEKSCY